jgi:predicted ABC-type transport system involved in lysophospholipase L1 biosynthesis ATPase subunit
VCGRGAALLIVTHDPAVAARTGKVVRLGGSPV